MPLSRELEPHLVQCGLGRGVLPYQAASSSIQPFGHNKHGTKIGWGACALFLRVAGSTSNTMSRRPRSTSVPSGTLIHAAIWPQQIRAENWGLCFFGGVELSPHLTQCGQGRGLPACQVSSSSVQPFDHSARTSQTDRRTGHTGQTDNGLIAYGEPFYTRSPKNDGQLNRSDTQKFDDLNAVNQRLGQLEKANVEHDR